MTIADAIPILGPLLADSQFRWWLLGLLLGLGPVPEDIPVKTTKKTDAGDLIEISTATTWKFGGLLRVLMTHAAAQSRLADRVASLETTVKDMGATMLSFTTELRLWRTSLENGGVLGQRSSSSGTRLAVIPAAGTDRRSDSGLRFGSGGT